MELLALCFPKIISGRSNDAALTVSAQRQLRHGLLVNCISGNRCSDEKISLLFAENSLLLLEKFPVPLHREFICKPLN
jgi:hypothetical protein